VSSPDCHPLPGLQLEERAACSAEFENSLQSSRSEIADLNVRIQKLRSQILSIKSHVSVRRTHLGWSRVECGTHALSYPSYTHAHTGCVYVSPGFVTLDRSLSIPVPQFPHLSLDSSEDHMSLAGKSAP